MLGKFAPTGIMADDGFKARRFQNGLREPTSGSVRAFELKAFYEVVNKARVVKESVFQREQH